MSEYAVSKIFIIGGTGAQGIPVIRGLVSDGKYSVRVLTRDIASPRAQHLKSLNPSHVELVEGTFASESDLRAGFRGCDGAFINIDGFNCGEKTETYWTIRCYEIAVAESIKFYVHGNLDYVLKKSGFDSKFRTGHYDGKGRMGEWILQQGKGNSQMGVALFTTGPYIEMAIASYTIFTPTVEDGVVTWRLPLGEQGGGVVHVALDDCEHYVRWLFDHPQRSNGMDLEVAIEHVSYMDMAAAFQKVTGHPARYVETSLEDYWDRGNVAAMAQQGSAYNIDPSDPSFMTIQQNFTGFFNMWKYSHGNEGVIKRDYIFLDEIYPDRIRSAEEWLRKEDVRGRNEGMGGLWERVQKKNLKPILKLSEDKRQGKL